MKSMDLLFVFLVVVAITCIAGTVASIAMGIDMFFLTFQIVMIETFILMVVICINEMLSNED